MLFVVLFEDNPEHADARQRLMAAHLAFLGGHSAQIHAAGPLLDTSTREGAGGMWLVNAADAAGVEQLYRLDPFWPTGLRRSVRVLEWTQVFRDPNYGSAAS